MILAVAKLTDRFAAITFEIDRGGVEENNIKSGKQITTHPEHILFNQILDASRCKRRLSFLIFQPFPKKGHGTIKMMQSQIVNAVDYIVPVPLVAISVGTGNKKPVQNGQKNSPLHIKAEFPFGKMGLDDPSDIQLL